ncbi:protein neprosin-like [Typha latifolia]|uniref:protein neprosin-like n=1 Tax=Typha latifolia TaxID=4733 RepID=UPI003C2EF01C
MGGQRSKAGAPMLLLAISYGIINVSASSYAGNRQVSALELEEIKQYLEKINKPALNSIQSPDGDIIDCVPVDKQPALDNPLLRNHTIQMMPSMLPTYRGGNYTTKNIQQLWNDVGSCPNGTIPIRRTKIEDVLRAGSLSQFGKKKLGYRSSTLASPPQGHEFWLLFCVYFIAYIKYAIAYLESTQNPIYGSMATFNVWNPYVEVDEEFSLSQLWVCAGSYENSDLNTIEAGWQVCPLIYGDSNTRLFIYWTANAYNGTGCYNLECEGFVQTDNSVAIGGALSPVSTYGGSQYAMTLSVFKDPSSGNWWLTFEDTFVGYWPSEIFTLLSNSATWLEWGGEIVNTSPNGEHTSTDMGSGYFAEEGYEKASYIRNIMIVDSSNNLSPPASIITSATNTNCYDLKSYNDTDWGVSFFFGGPGKSSLCT